MKNMTYREAGVDIDAGESLVEKIKPMVASTMRPEVLTGIGGFSSLVALPSGLKEPLLVSGTDGVGTKLKLAFEANNHKTVGIDLVAMCANDVLVTGAEPLFFLDYYACSELSPVAAAEVISGIAEGCRQAGCALVGGETAELPGFYSQGEYDLAGFVVGVVDKSRVITGEKSKIGDQVIGLASTGVHSNGFSLARAVLKKSGLSLSDKIPGYDEPLSETLLRPTQIYCRAIKTLMDKVEIKALAHITGGGLVDNMHRTLPKELSFRIESGWPIPPVFRWLAETGPVEESEMLRTFNMGIGMTAVVSKDEVETAIACLAENGISSFRIGEVIASEVGKPRVIIKGKV